MRKAMIEVLCGNALSIYLYGSAATGDFRFGWSDIDILCLTRSPLSESQASLLLELREKLSEELHEPYFGLFEGAVLSLDAFFKHSGETVVYWGTGHRRIADSYRLDSFGAQSLLSDGILLYGNDIRSQLSVPGYDELKKEVIVHYETIRKYAVKTGRSIYSYGWLFDIARGIYTLRTGKIIAKTRAGEWALENDLCPAVADSLSRALQVRKTPEKYRTDESCLAFAETLGRDIQSFADVMEKEINCANEAVSNVTPSGAARRSGHFSAESIVCRNE